MTDNTTREYQQVISNTNEVIKAVKALSDESFRYGYDECLRKYKSILAAENKKLKDQIKMIKECGSYQKYIKLKEKLEG